MRAVFETGTREADAARNKRLRALCAALWLSLGSSCVLVGYDPLPPQPDAAVGAMEDASFDASIPDAGVTDAVISDAAVTDALHTRIEHPTGPAADDLFGDALALDPETLVIGVPYDDAVARDGGAAYAYRLDDDGEWSPGVAIYGSQVGEDDHFGEHIDLDGDRMVIGADHSAGEGSGALGLVYVFERIDEEWVETDILPHEDDPVDRTQLGNRLAIDGDWIVVTGFTDVYFYHREGGQWTFAQALGLDLGKASRLAIDGATAVMSFDDDGGDGQVLVFERDGDAWVEAAELVSSDDDPGDMLGRSSLALQGDTVVVSAHGYGGSGPGAAGAAYVFERSDGVWSQTQRLQASSPAEGEEFASTLALDGQILAVGVPRADAAGEDVGAVDLFASTEDGWRWRRRVLPSQPVAGGMMGFSDLRLSGRLMAFSGEQAEVSGETQAGAVEVVVLD